MAPSKDIQMIEVSWDFDFDSSDLFQRLLKYFAIVTKNLLGDTDIEELKRQLCSDASKFLLQKFFMFSCHLVVQHTVVG